MKNDKKFIPVMLMPFREDKSIDYTTLNSLVDFYLQAGAGGLFANCLSSEMFDLSVAEMKESVAHIVKRVNGRVPVVATGSFGNSLEEKATTVREIYETGVSAVILITGLLADESEGEETFRANVLEILRLTPEIPVGFYECPVPYKRVISPALLEELVKSGRVKYHKDTCLDINIVQEKIKVTSMETAFGLYDAYMAHAVESLKAGSAGLSCIQGNYFPELVVWLCDHYNEPGAEQQVGEVQSFFRKHMDLMHATYPASAKYVLHKRGLKIKEYCRNGSVVTPDKVFKELDLLLEEADALLARLVSAV